MTAANPPPTNTAVPREILNLSTNPATYISVIDINDVKPANTNDAKNKKPNVPFNAGSTLMICGNTTNANPTPASTTSSTATPDWRAINPRTENTHIPASSSKLEFPKPTIKAWLAKYDHCGTSLAYANIMANAIDILKKICPYAAIQTLGSRICEKSGLKKASKPCNAPGNVTARRTIIKNIIVNVGIKMRLATSIPFR